MSQKRMNQTFFDCDRCRRLDSTESDPPRAPVGWSELHGKISRGSTPLFAKGYNIDLCDACTSKLLEFMAEFKVP